MHKYYSEWCNNYSSHLNPTKTPDFLILRIFKKCKEYLTSHFKKYKTKQKAIFKKQMKINAKM